VRFAVSAPRDSAGGDEAPAVTARTLFLRYVCERNHAPVEHGDLEFDLSRTTWIRRHDDARVQKMAECFLESYLRKKS
jgi:hypothetical protein